MHVFVTGASGWIGSAIVPELLGAGHAVSGLARSDAAAAAVEAAGARVVRGSLDDTDGLRDAAAAADAVIHLAFRHDLAFTGRADVAAAVDAHVVEVLGEALAGTDRPLTIAAGTLGVAPGTVLVEDATPWRDLPDTGREASNRVVLGLAERGVRSSIVRLAPSVHGAGDPGFLPALIAAARRQGAAGYPGDGTARWPAVARSDAARLFRLAIETAPAGSVLHAVADEGLPVREIMTAVGRGLDLPVRSVPPEQADEAFGFLAGFLGLDAPASSAITRRVTGWQPTGPGLLDDLAEGHYFTAGPR